MQDGISGEQCRAARQLLNWKASDLAEASGVSLRAISDFETGHRDFRHINMQAVIEAFVEGGIDFLPESGGKGEGVRLSGPRPV
jgi:transcriptional regulator with XRE-family HTH domain